MASQKCEIQRSDARDLHDRGVVGKGTERYLSHWRFSSCCSA